MNPQHTDLLRSYQGHSAYSSVAVGLSRSGTGAMHNGASADLVVVGAGILGLAVAREALRRHPGLRVLVLEKEGRIASHQTGHNSGVIHAGIYYVPGSLKARLCVEGSSEVYAYCDEKGIPYERCGKVVVATREDELPRLEELHRRARENRVAGIALVDEARLADLEPNVVGLRALYSPNTGIVDFRRVAQALADDVTALGGGIRISANVVAIKTSAGGAELKTADGAFRARGVITCGGLYSDRLATLTGAPPTPKIVPFRGRYYALRPNARALVRGLVYPVPDPAFPFLGVHFTKQISGDVWTGPNAVLAFAREGYRGRDVKVSELWETLSYSGFRALAARYWRVGLGEVRGELSRRTYTQALQRLVPAVRKSDLGESHAGVRAQALSEDGRLLDDFWFDHAENVIHVRNAPSPGATSSLALAREIVREAEPAISLR
jgi:(S)-2-hydroxyglutarate dehydrogenase